MLVTMSDKELRRINVIQAVCEKRLRRRDAAGQHKTKDHAGSVTEIKFWHMRSA